MSVGNDTSNTPLYVNVEDTKSDEEENNSTSYIQMTKRDIIKKRAETSYNNYINTTAISSSE